MISLCLSLNGHSKLSNGLLLHNQFKNYLYCDCEFNLHFSCSLYAFRIAVRTERCPHDVPQQKPETVATFSKKLRYRFDCNLSKAASPLRLTDTCYARVT